jgi:hypothetical protein
MSSSTGKIKVLFTIDVGTAKSGSEQFLSGIFYNEDVIITDYANYRIVMYDGVG